MTDYLETQDEVRPGQSFEALGAKWIVLRVAGPRAEIKQLRPDEKPKPKPNRKARRKLWAEVKKELRRKAKKARVAG